MIEKFCNYILKKMKNKMPDMPDEQSEIIAYGLQLLIGELPKLLILFGIGFLFGVGWYMLFAYFAMLPYRTMSGGFHLKSHLGCILGTVIFYYGNIIISNMLILDNLQKYLLIALTWTFGILMVSMYAPADTENVPIISKKERKKKKILSYITLTITLLVAAFIPIRIISNILIIGTIIQTISITRIAYKITKNKYGYEEYLKQVENNT